MKNNILYVGGFRLPNGNSSALRVIPIARMLNSMGYSTIVGGLIDGDISNYSDISFWQYNINKSGVTVKRDIEITAITDKIEEIGKENLKAVIAYNYAPIAFYRLYKYCQNHGINLIPDVTEWYLIDGKISIGKVLRVLLTTWRIQVISPKCQHIIVAVEYFKLKFKKNNVLCLPVVSDNTNSKHKAIEVEHDTVLKFVYAGYCGGHFSKELLNVQLRAFASLPIDGRRCEFNVIGISEDQVVGFDTKLKSIIESSNHKINFHGRKQHSETLQLIKQNHFVFFIRPYNRVSKYGFPGKVREAFELGIPVITNNTGDLERYVINGVNGFMVKGNEVEAVALKLQEIRGLSQDVLNSIFKQCAANNPFAQVNMVEKTKDFFDQIK